jgi:DNA modification methylase
MNTHRIIQGDCIKGMATLPEGCVNTCITSPPYFGLRSYNGGDDEIGQEPTVDEFVQKMVEVFRGVRRILRDDGTLWLNLGDSYMSATCVPPPQTVANGNNRGMPTDFIPANRQKQNGLKQKDLIGIPWRVALALQADGWYLRQDIIWHKPNPMPESVEDRCTKAHEYIFLLSKKPKYYFDFEAIKEPVTNSTVQRLSQENLSNQVGSTRVPGKTNGNMKAVGGTETRNKRSVWTVTTKPFRGAHFATFPKELIEPCVLVGCPKGGTVFDPFTGSGTTAIVALNNERHYIGTELNPDYIALAEGRIRDEVTASLSEFLA